MIKNLKITQQFILHKTLSRIGKVLNELLEKNDRFFTDFSGLVTFSNRKNIVGTEMNQHRYFMQSLFFYLRPFTNRNLLIPKLPEC